MLQKIGEQKFERRIISKPFKAYKDRFAMYAQYLLGLGPVCKMTCILCAPIFNHYQSIQVYSAEGPTPIGATFSMTRNSRLDSTVGPSPE